VICIETWRRQGDAAFAAIPGTAPRP
jgi:hypothetical protein